MAIALLAVSGAASGGEPIFSSKWAMDVEEYADKYSQPYSDDPLIRKSQVRREMFDASFHDGSYGFYAGGGGAVQDHWTVGTLNAGMFKMPTSWSTVRVGASMMVASGRPMGGTEFGIRLHTPTRLAPFVGVAGVLELSGFQRQTTRSYWYYDANGNRQYYAQRGGYFPAGMAAIVPELGVSYWLKSDRRLNLWASYYFTNGRPPDFLMLNVSMDYALRNGGPPSPPAQPFDEFDDISNPSNSANPYFSPDDPNIQRLEQGDQYGPPLVPHELEPGPTPMPPNGVDDPLPAPLSAPKGFVPSPPEALLPKFSPTTDEVGHSILRQRRDTWGRILVESDARDVADPDADSEVSRDRFAETPASWLNEVPAKRVRKSTTVESANP